MDTLEGILKTKKFDTPFNQTIEFLTQSYAATPNIIPYDLVEYLQQYLILHIEDMEKSEEKVKEELKKKLDL